MARDYFPHDYNRYSGLRVFSAMDGGHALAGNIPPGNRQPGKSSRTTPSEAATMTKYLLFCMAPIALVALTPTEAFPAPAAGSGSIARNIAAAMPEVTDSPLVLVRGGRGGGGGGGGGFRGGGGGGHRGGAAAHRGGGYGGGHRGMGGGNWAGAGGNRGNFNTANVGNRN